MRNLAMAMQVKDSSIFDLLHHTFYERDFIFFAHLAVQLGNLTGCSEKEALEFGELSELLYLSSLLHFSLTEHTETTEQLRAEKQMPVLLGDLLYGRFISALIKNKKTVCLPIYFSYLKQFNADGVEHLEGRKAYAMGDAIVLLTKKTAEAMAVFAGVEKDAVTAEAERYLETHWELLQGEKVSTYAALESLLQREFSQGAVVC